MRWKSHVRFGGRAGETHRSKDDRALRSDPYTEHPTDEGKLYLFAIKDVWSTRIVGYSMSSRMTAALAVSALSNAVALRDPDGTVVHSDRGSQFRANVFVIALKKAGLVGSMGRVGACGDNAAMESFFSLRQKNVLDRQRWLGRLDVAGELEELVDEFVEIHRLALSTVE
jgi:transposase InsO family protein